MGVGRGEGPAREMFEHENMFINKFLLTKVVILISHCDHQT